jgi:hypothetical protein
LDSILKAMQSLKARNYSLMNLTIMNLFPFHSSVKQLINETIGHTLVLLHEPLDYTSEGSEFLDDAIRMKEQPLLDREQGVAQGSQGSLDRSQSI